MTLNVVLLQDLLAEVISFSFCLWAVMVVPTGYVVWDQILNTPIIEVPVEQTQGVY